MRITTIVCLAIIALSGCEAMKNVKNDPGSYEMLVRDGLVVALIQCDDRQACAKRYYDAAVAMEGVQALNNGLSADSLLDLFIDNLQGGGMPVEQQIFIEDLVKIYRKHNQLPGGLPAPDADAMAGFALLVKTVKETAKRFM